MFTSVKLIFWDEFCVVQNCVLSFRVNLDLYKASVVKIKYLVYLFVLAFTSTIVQYT